MKKKVIRITSNTYSGPWGFLAQVVVMTLAAIVAAYIVPGVEIETTRTAILTAVVIALLNNFIRPILIVITLPFTIGTMGLFLLVVNAVIILLASRLVNRFHVDGFWSAFFFSLLLTAINYLLEIPNKYMRRPEYQPSENSSIDDHVDTDNDGFASYEDVTDSYTDESNNQEH